MASPVSIPDLVCVPRKGREPYRFLFPLGWFLGVVGVSLWPLFFYGLIPVYPATAHARIMIQGFAASFVIGFLGTAAPHMLEAPSVRTWFSFVMGMGLLLVSLLHIFQFTVWGDMLFALLLAVFMVTIGSLWPRRTSMPPPGMLAVAAGVLGAFFATLMLSLNRYYEIPDFLYFFSRLLLYQGFLLLPVMGVSATLLPNFTGYARTQMTPNTRERSPQWTALAMRWIIFVALILASLAVEAAGYIRAGYMLRGIVLIGFLYLHLPVWRRHQALGTIAWLNRLSLLAVLMGYLVAAVWTTQYMAWLHIVFISGFGSLIFAVAARVIWAHGGDVPRCLKAHPVLWWVFGLLTLAMLTRVSADWMPAAQLSHYAYAAMSWVVGAVLWAWALRRKPANPRS